MQPLKDIIFGKRKKEFIKLAESYLKQQQLVIKLANEYQNTMQPVRLSHEVQTMVIRESLAAGNTDHRDKVISLLEKTKNEHLKKMNDAEKKYQKALAGEEELREKYNQMLNQQGIVQVVYGAFIIILIIAILLVIISCLDVWFPQLMNEVNNFFSSINIAFYEASFQLIIALTVALYIGTNKNKVSATRRWWAYSKLAKGLIWAVVSLGVCLVALSGVEPNLITFVIVTAGIVTLIWSSLSPFGKLLKS